MRRIEAILPAVLAVVFAVVIAASMAGCAAKKSTNPAMLTPPNPPVIPGSFKPVREPLSIPQTHVQLPPPQPVNPAALEIPSPPAPVVPTPATAPKTVRRNTTAVPPPKPEPAAPAAQPAEPERAPIQEIVPPDERRRFQESANARKRETVQLLERAQARRLTVEQKKTVTRIQSFLAQSDDAEKRGDLRQADALADRGLVLAKELAGGQ